MSTMVVSDHPTGFSTTLGILLILVGVVAIAAPLLAGVAISVVLGFVILAGGLAHLIYAWTERGVGAVLWQVVIGIVYLVAGVSLLLHPVAGVVGLTFVLAIYIGIEGVVELLMYFRVKHVPGTIWFLIDGVVSLLLAGLIFAHWPVSSAWALGTLVGVSLIMSGIARFSLPAGRRRLALSV